MTPSEIVLSMVNFDAFGSPAVAMADVRLTPKPDISVCLAHVRYGSEADIALRAV